MRLVFLLPLTLIFQQTVAQDEKDILVQQSYYNKVIPISISSKSNLLYNGIDNFLRLQFPDEASKKFHYYVKSHNGIVTRTDSGYVVVPKFAGRAFISVFMITSHKDTLILGKKEFKVVNLPLPTVKVGDVVINSESVVDRKTFFSGNALKVFFTDDIPNSDTWCNVLYFNLGYSFGGSYVSVDNNGALPSKETIDFIKKIRSGQEITIKVVNISSSIVVKDLPLVRFRML